MVIKLRTERADHRSPENLIFNILNMAVFVGEVVTLGPETDRPERGGGGGGGKANRQRSKRTMLIY